jgi:hypothetical protein
LRRRTQAAWRARNPEYATAWRIQRRALNERGAAPVMRPPLDRLPWDLAKDEFGAQGAELLGVLGRLLVGVAKDEIRTQVLDTT